MKMTKKYFVKFIIVEGDVEFNDYFLADPLSDSEPYEIMRATKNVELDLIKLKGYPKIKPFLCSNKIQIGDKNIKYLGAYSSNHPIIIENENDKEFAIQWDAYKIIGEISPEATWVKEGMEFDEDEIRYSLFDSFEWIDNYDMNNKNDKEHWNTAQYPYQKFIKIKGSCGHFH